jgi:hypothetical protein
MVERSKKPSSRARPAPHEFAVVVESLRGEFRVFGEALAGFREQVTHEFAQVRGDLAAVKVDLAEVKVDVARLKDAVLENTRELGRHSHRIDDLARAVEKKVDRDEVEAIVERAMRRKA